MADDDSSAASLRERNAASRRVHALRLAGVTGFFAPMLVLGGVLGRSSWQGNLGLFGAYWLLAAALVVASRRTDRLTPFTGILVGAIDMPATFFLARAALPGADSGPGLAGFCTGIYVSLVFLGALGEGRGTTVFVTVSAVVFQSILAADVGVRPRPVVATAMLMVLAGATCVVARQQSAALWDRVRGGAEGRDRAEEALRETERSFRKLTDGSPDAISVVRGGVLVYVNYAFAECLGFTDGAELVGRRYAEFVVGEDREEHRQRVRVAATGSRPRTSEERLVRRDGTHVALESAALRVTFQGEPAVVVVGRDVTERNRLASELDRARQAAARVEKLAAVGQLAAGVAHDLRNPLSAARNAFHWLEKRVTGADFPREARVGQAVALVDRELRACSTILEELLDFARERPLARKPTALAALVDDAASVVRLPAHVTVVNLVSAELPSLDVDPDQLRQVLVNLMQNGAEAAPPDRGRAEVRVHAETVPDAVVIEIEDQGAGIPKENLERIFEPLFTTRVRGTGLGLATVATIVKRHGGSIEVTSEVGVGTTFRVRVPTPPAASG